jgi:putative ABC transport system substrate-binding protein
MVSRRNLLLGCAAALLPQARAQSPAPPRVGLISTTVADNPIALNFRDELAKLGHVEGRTLILEPRYAAGKLDLLPGFAQELVGMNVDLMTVIGAVTVRAVRSVSTTVPLVFTVVLDPVADGLVPNAQRPGGNTTGATNYDPAQPRAQMRLLKQVVPGLATVAILGDAGVPDLLDRANKEAAEAEGLRPLNVRLRGPGEDIDAVFARLREERTGAVLGLEVPAAGAHARRIVELGIANRWPTMAPGDAERFGATLSYGSSLWAASRRMGHLVDRVLKGAKPGELPIEVVTTHRFVINQGNARKTGVTIPPEVLARADKVIE